MDDVPWSLVFKLLLLFIISMLPKPRFDIIQATPRDESWMCILYPVYYRYEYSIPSICFPNPQPSLQSKPHEHSVPFPKKERD